MQPHIWTVSVVVWYIIIFDRVAPPDFFSLALSQRASGTLFGSQTVTDVSSITWATLTLAIQPNIVNKTSATSAISSPTALCWCSCYSYVFNTSHGSPCTFQNWRLRQNAFLPELWMSPNMLYLMEEFTFIFSPLKSKYQIIFTIFAWYILFSLQLVFFTTVTGGFRWFINLTFLLFWKHMTDVTANTTAPLFPSASSSKML